MRAAIALTGCVLLLLAACAPEKQETTTHGNLHVLIAESIAPPMIEEVEAFAALNEKNGAHLTYTLLSTDAAIQRLIQDTARFVIATRSMTESERGSIPQVDGFELNEIVLAYDAIAVVVNEKNPVGELTTEELTKVLSGAITRWEQLGRSKAMKGTIDLVLQDSSDVSMFVEARLMAGATVRKDVKHTTSSPGTLTSVAEDRNSLGLVGIAWIDSARGSVKSLKVAETRRTDDTTFQIAPEAFGKSYSTHPAHIYRSYYPLKRTIYLYTFGRLGSLVTGFGTYIAGNDGQRLLLNRNIVPGTRPVKLKAPPESI